MSFFSGIEQFFSGKRTNKYNSTIFTAIYLFFSISGILICLLEGAKLSAFILALMSLLSVIIAKEIKSLHLENDLLVFQKNIVTNSYDASSSAFFVFSDAGKLIFFNRLVEDLFPGANIKNIEDFVKLFENYNKIAPAVRTIQSAVEKGKVHHIDVPVILDINSSVWWRIFASPIKGFKKYTVWSITDLTPSFKNLDILDSNSAFLLDIINSSSASYFTINSHGAIVFCNSVFAKIINLPISRVLDCSFDDLVDKEKSDELPVANGAGKLTKSIPSKIVFKTNNENGICIMLVKQIWVSKDGEMRTYSAIIQPEKDEQLVHVLCTTKLYFERIFEDAPVGIAITDGAEILSACNRTFRKLTEYNEQDLSADVSFLSFVAEESKESVKSKLYELLNGVHSFEKPFEIGLKNRKNNKSVVVYANKIDGKNDINQRRGLVLYCIDISDRKELQNQFVQSQKMQAIGQLAGGVAHDFNNLLTAMIGYCDILLAKYLPTDQSFADVMQIKQNANRASNLVRQLLAFSRQQTMQPKVVNVTDMLVDLMVLLNRLIGAKVELKINHGKDIGCIKVDQIQFEQVIINLVVNARDAMPNGGTLIIKTDNYSCSSPNFLRGETMPVGSYVLIEIIDTGFGIPENILNRIFDPFFSTKEKGSGTGLGLSTVYGIVNQTGGFIDVESVINKGTKFSLYFPMCSCDVQDSQKATYHETPSIQADLTGSGKILLVEDEDAVRMFSSRALRDKGYTVIEASNGESALEFIKAEGGEIDLMITDVVMPKMDGPTLINYVKKFASSMRVIFISGYTEDSFRQSLANDTNVHFLAKPFNLRDLASKVKEVMSEEP